MNTKKSDILNDLEKGFDTEGKKSTSSPQSLAKAQDDFKAGKVDSAQAMKQAGIKKDDSKAKMPTTKKKPVQKKKVPVKKEKVTKKILDKKVTVQKEDGHTYVGDNPECVNCGLHKNDTTTNCFGQELYPAMKYKFSKGLIDYVDGSWVAVEKK